MKRFKDTVQLDSNLLIPASAGAGKVLTSDAIGNAAWASPATAGAINTGDIVMHARFGTPSGYVRCDGAGLSRTTYAGLIAALTLAQPGTRSGTVNITGLGTTEDMAVGMAVEGTGIPAGATIASIVSGTAITLSATSSGSGTATVTVFAWGNGNGSTTFNAPDMRGRSPMGPGTGASPTLTARGIGQKVGTETHTLDITQIPAHNHPFSGYLAGAGGTNTIVAPSLANPANLNWGVAPTTPPVGSSGGGLSHPNVQPSLVVPFVIKT